MSICKIQHFASRCEFNDPRLAILRLWRNPTRLLVVRRGKPLFFCETARGFYFASVPEGLPGRPMSVGDNYAGVLAFDRGALGLESRQPVPTDG